MYYINAHKEEMHFPIIGRYKYFVSKILPILTVLVFHFSRTLKCVEL